MASRKRIAPSLPIDGPIAAPLLPQAIPPHLRISLPLSRVLDFARKESDAQPSRQLAGALRPLLGVALATAGLCQGVTPEMPDAAPLPPPYRPNGRPPAAGDSEILFTALSSLVEVVKSLTPTAGRIYAHLGHEASGGALDSAHPADDDPAEEAAAFEQLAGSATAPPGDGDDDHDAADADDAAGDHPAPAGALDSGGGGPRSEVVIELVSVASPAYESLSPAIHNALGALAFELATVAAILESKGGQLHLAAPGSHSRRFVVRLPVWRS